MTNRIVDENQLEGTSRAYWDVPHSNQIEGFTTDISVNAGGTVEFKINVNGAAADNLPYKIEIFRLGYYDGDGARQVETIVNADGTVQPAPNIDRARGLVDAGNWTVTDSWQVPEEAVSGVYLARMQRLDVNGVPIAGAVNQIPFIVRNDGVAADIVLQTSDTTWHAYNGWGGNNGAAGANFYGDAGGVADGILTLPDPGLNQDRAYAVSYNRPFITRDGSANSPAAGAQDYLFGADYAAIYWLEKNGYDVTYISGVDADRLGTSWFEDAQGTNIRQAYISVGHDEYWSGAQRANVEAARDAGVNLLFWSGNEVYWKTRYEDSTPGGDNDYRTLVSYKETWANRDPNADPAEYANIDPSNEWTGTWRDLRFVNATANNGVNTNQEPENSLTGQLFGPDGTGQFGGALDVPASFGGLRFWRGTAAANGELDIAAGLIGYEWNVVPDDEYRPAGLIKLSETTLNWNGILVDQGNTTAPGTATHNLSLYRADSGALVFGSGTTFWTWGLSNQHDSSPYGANIENAILKQFTVNLFADMGIQPGSLEAGLILATASTDKTPASVTLNDIPATVPQFTPVVISGTATDDDGNALTDDGVVALVEVSLDGGQTWRTADGTTNWSYRWQPLEQQTYDIWVRAIDDSLNVTAGVLGDTVTVTEPVFPDEFSLFDPFTQVTGTLANDNKAVEVGLKFEADRAGLITELKYYRAPGDSGDTDTRTLNLWNAAGGAPLASVVVTSNPNQSGWQVGDIPDIRITPNTIYVVSYGTADNYLATNGFFNTAFSEFFGVLSAPATGGSAGGNGVYIYQVDVPQGQAPFPTFTYQGENYWADITFVPTTGDNQAPYFTFQTSAFPVPENQLAVTTLTAIDPDGTQPSFAIAGGADAARFNINATSGALTFKLPPNYEVPTDLGGDNSYEITVSVSDNIAAPVSQNITVTVTDQVESSMTISNLFDQNLTPTGQSADASYELGTKFVTTVGGDITALQYYRVADDVGDTDVRTLRLWNATTGGAPLAVIEVTSEANDTGWQVAELTTPVSIVTGQTYIVSYGFVLDGGPDFYAFNPSYFTGPRPGPGGILIGVDTNISPNGVFAANAPGTLPTSSFNANNYWVDVVFESSSQPINTPPEFSSPATFLSLENQTLVGTLSATDANSNLLTFAIAGGTDAALFTVNASTGLLEFKNPQDFEGGDTQFDLTVSVSDGIAPAVTQNLTVNLTDVDETVDGPAAFTGSNLTAEYIFGTTPDTLYANGATGVTQTATVGAGVEFQNLPNSGTGVDNGPFGLATVDVGAQVIRIELPVAPSFGDFLPLDGAGQGRPYNGVRLSDTTNNLATILSAAIIGQEGFTNRTGTPQQLTSSDLTVTPDGIFLNVAGKGRLKDIDGDLAGNQPAYVTILVDLNDAPEITGEATATAAVAENTTLVATLASTDADAGHTGIFSVIGGENAALFGIVDNQLSFLSAPDFEALDEGVTPGYQVTVQVADGFGGIDTQDITVTVTNVSGTIVGDAFNNVLNGTSEEDTISGLGGNDTLTGGDGADTFVRDANGTVAQSDTITDFSIAEGDKINLGPSGPASFEALSQYLLRSSGSDTVLSGFWNSTGQSLTLTGVAMSSLTASQFIFDTSLDPREFSGTSGADLIFGGLGNDKLSGGDGVDYLIGDAGADELDGGTGDDRLFGDAGNDTLLGGSGRDSLNGGTGADTMTGGTEGDIYYVDDAVDTVIEDPGHAGIDTVYTSISYTLTAGVEYLTQQGTADIDGTGNALDNSMAGNSGNNSLDGGDGNDALNGNAGNDTLIGGAGNDRLNGGAGNDTMTGGTGGDIYWVDDAGDVVIEDPGHAGIDTVYASISYALTGEAAGVEYLTQTGTGNIDATGNALNNSFVGNSGNNRLDGGDGNDTLKGNAGNDILIGGAGNDLIDGGSETDTAVFTGSRASYTISGSLTNLTVTDAVAGRDGRDTVLNGEFIQFADGSVSVADLLGSPTNDTLIGGNGPDTLIGGAGDDKLFGNGGNDTLLGGSGRDSLNGGTGADTMTGGTEGDIYYVDDAGDAVIEEPGHAGIDTVYTSITYTLSPGVEYLTLQGTADIHGTGNALDNSMAGNSGNNRLDGGDGNDALNGNAGSDLLIGGAGNDRLNGGAGDDTMIGGTGGDIYWVDDAGDIVVEDPGHAGIDTVYASISYALTGEAAGVEYLTQTGTGNIEATGNALNNSFVGNSGNNRLDGGDGNDTLKGNAGNDTLIGGAGNDALYGGSGSDTFLFAAGSGKDVIYDFNVAEDKLDLGDYGIDTAAGLTLIASNYGSALQVDFGDGNTVTIQNTQVNQIDDGWFV